MSDKVEKHSPDEMDMIELFKRLINAIEATEKRLSKPETDHTKIYAEAADKTFEENRQLFKVIVDLFNKSNTELSLLTTNLERTSATLTDVVEINIRHIDDNNITTETLKKITLDLKPRWWAKRTVIGFGGLFVGIIAAATFSYFTISNNMTNGKMNTNMCRFLDGEVITLHGDDQRYCHIVIKDQ